MQTLDKTTRGLPHCGAAGPLFVLTVLVQSYTVPGFDPPRGILSPLPPALKRRQLESFCKQTRRSSLVLLGNEIVPTCNANDGLVSKDNPQGRCTRSSNQARNLAVA
jgi:hypothetical protein